MATDLSSVYQVRVADTGRILAGWETNPWPMLRRWLAGSAAAAFLLLLGTLLVAELAHPSRDLSLAYPPVVVGGPGYMLTILEHNILVLALHSFACVAGFIAGATIPAEAAQRGRVSRWVHEHGARLALGFVLLATFFSLFNQVWHLGTAASAVAHELGTSPALLLLALLPHAAPELTALFLPLSAWVIASRTNRWDELLAAAIVTTAVAIPMLILAATWETYGAAHLVALVAHH